MIIRCYSNILAWVYSGVELRGKFMCAWILFLKSDGQRQDKNPYTKSNINLSFISLVLD